MRRVRASGPERNERRAWLRSSFLAEFLFERLQPRENGLDGHWTSSRAHPLGSTDATETKELLPRALAYAHRRRHPRDLDRPVLPFRPADAGWRVFRKRHRRLVGRRRRRARDQVPLRTGVRREQTGAPRPGRKAQTPPEGPFLDADP